MSTGTEKLVNVGMLWPVSAEGYLVDVGDCGLSVRFGLLVGGWHSSGVSFSEADGVCVVSDCALLPCLVDADFVGPTTSPDEFL